MLLIAGSNGYVGNYFKKLLQTKNINFCSIQLVDQDSGPTHFRLVNQDKEILVEGPQIRIIEILKKLGVTSAINFAAVTSKESDFENRSALFQSNVVYNKELVEISVSSGVKNFHYISTYSSSTDGFEFSPQTFYAGTKYVSERLLETYAFCDLINVSIIEVYDIYGPNQPHRRLFNYCFDSLLAGKHIQISDGEQEISLIHVEDVIAGIFCIVSEQSNSAKKIQHHSLYSDSVCKVREVPLIISESTGIPLFIDQIDRSLEPRKREIMRVSPRFQRPENWTEKYSLRDGIKQVYNVLNNNGSLINREET